MHALARVGMVTGQPHYVRWATELAETAVERFSRGPSSDGSRRMVWKMSIDLTRPLVDSQGQHDPLDGLVTCLELRHAAGTSSAPAIPHLDPRIAGLAAMLQNQPFATADPLGIGGLLTAACTLAQLVLAGLSGYDDLLVSLLEEARPGLAYQVKGRDILAEPADERLAFRELGLSLGMRAVGRTQQLVESNPHAFGTTLPLGPCIRRLRPYLPLIDAIEDFWLEPANRTSRTWKEHEDINAVMLATSLAPDAYLML
jgi:hypothetical protein